MRKLIKIFAAVTAIGCILSFLAVKAPFIFNNNLGNFGFSDDNRRAVKTNEMRALWVPFMSLELKDGNRAYADFKDKFNGIMNTAINNDLNTLIVHIRPFCDALYKSDIFPASHILTGVQGGKCDFDALKYMITAAHRRGLYIHAWINPYRVTSDKSNFELSDKNPIYNLDSDSVLEWENGIYLNPSSYSARELIINGVKEVLENYDVDGIHFDDYFYPTTAKSYDKSSYDNYLSTLDENSIPLTLNEWRTANVNMLISYVYKSVHSVKKDVVFGISPQGNVQNDLNMGADVYAWGSIPGYVDYLCPQIYTNDENPYLPFKKTCKQWQKLVKLDNVKLYIGLALYKSGSDCDEGTWLKSQDDIARQIAYTRKLNCDGFALYSYEYLSNKETEKEVAYMLDTIRETA
ncbi:MAG: family 10 glycosylhydrolase [Clostridiales bacterium]|nr:family 10 glycosylhydrolase [Clostridiales bacterium]